MATILNNGQPVTTEKQLNDAIVQAHNEAANSGPFEIDLGGNISLTTGLEAINLQSGVTLDIEGNGHTLDGGGTQRGLFVYAGTVDINNLAINHMQALGGDGGFGAGGGGAGLGGGLFVGANVPGDLGNVTLTNVTFANDKATGGNGGKGGIGYFGGGGGGGLGGAGGGAVGVQGGVSLGRGGGGGGGLGAGGGFGAFDFTGGNGGTGVLPGGSSGGKGGNNARDYHGGSGGGGGGGGGGGAGGVASTAPGLPATTLGAGGGGGGGVGGRGGGGGTPDVGGVGGDGGYGGGGGGGGTGTTGLVIGGGPGGNGSFGGGGGGGGTDSDTGTYGHGGRGGFGGGGGGGNSSGVSGGTPGFGGGPGASGSNGRGGGGLGAGGDIFVQAGASLTIGGSGSVGVGTVNGGTGGPNPQVGFGKGFANGIYLQGNGNTLTFTPSGTLTVAGVIGDDTGSAAAASYGGAQGYNEGSVGILVNGAGTLDLTGHNTYSGATTISAGTLELGSGGSIARNVTFTAAGSTLQFDTGTNQLGGAIIGAVGGDTIDLRFQSFASSNKLVWQQNTGTLSLFNGSTTLATLTLAGQYTNSNFIEVSDGFGVTPGTLIKVHTPINATDAAPVVTTPNGTSFTVSYNAPVAASTFFTASDADTDSIDQYDFWDNGSAGGTWLLNGIALKLGTDNFVNAAQLSQVTYRGGAGTETIWERASDGIQFGAWTSVNATDTAPVVTALNANVTLSHNTPVAATTLFTAADADTDSIVQYDFWDNGSAGGTWLLNGNAMLLGRDNFISASQLSQVTYRGGAGTETIWERASDGIQFGAWTSVNATDTAPVVTALNANVTLSHNTPVAATTLFTAADADTDSIVQYDFWDTGSAGGHWLLNGVALPNNQENLVPASQLSQVTYQAGGGTETIYERASDGIQFGAWTSANATDTAPVVTAIHTTVSGASNLTFAPSNLFTVSETDGDSIAQYDLWSTGGGGGDWLLNGLPLSINNDNFVTPAQLSQVVYRAGNSTDTIWMRASDGAQFGAWSQALTVTDMPVVTPNSNAVIATNGQTFAASSLFSAQDGDGDTITQYDLVSTAIGGGEWMLNGVPLPDNHENFVSSLAGVTYKAGPGQDSLVVRASDGTQFGEFTSWTVNSLPIALFTNGSDTVNFNALTPDQAAEVAAGADLYHGLGGSDTVTLPDIANYNESVGNGKTLGWVAGTTFIAGDTAAPTYTITGGNGPDIIQLGAGIDTVYGSPGNDVIMGGTGQDTFDYQNGKYANFSGPFGTWPAMTQTITGGHSSFQTDASKPNIIKLPGSANDYQFNVLFNSGDTFSGTQTSIGPVSGAPAYVINTTGVEKADFADPINNEVALADNNIAVEMLQLAAEVYGPQLNSLSIRDPLAWEKPSGTNTGAKVAIAAQSRGWHPVSAMELGMAPADFGQFGTLEYSFVGGQYQAIDTSQSKQANALPEANALVLTGLVHDPVSGTDKRTLAIVIRGTDQLADALLDYADFKTHYDKFKPLVQDIQNYLDDPSNGIQQVLISGHSLGAGVVPYFLHDLPDTSTYSVHAYVDGPPGSEDDAGDSRIENFVHAGVLFGPTPPNDHSGDPVPILGEASHGDYSNVGKDDIDYVKKLIAQRHIMPKSRMGSDVLIDDDVPEGTPSIFTGPGPQHNHNLYAADLAKLVRFANDDSSPFAWTDGTKTQHSAIALSLRAGSVYQGSPVAAAVGQPTSAEQQELISSSTNFVDPTVYANQPYAPDINVYWRDDYVLSEADGIIHWDQPWTDSNGQLQFNANEHLHVVDGGSTTAPSSVDLPGSSSSYDVTKKMTALGPETDLSWIDSSNGAHLIGQLYRIGTLRFLGDGVSSPNTQYVMHLDGSAVSVQTVLAGQATLMVDPSFDYTDAGNGNLAVIGSGTGDFVALGSGNDTVVEPGGNNTIFVKDAASAGNDIVVCGPGEDTVALGDGTNQIVGTTGILTVDFSGDRSQYQITRLSSGALQIKDERSPALNGTDIVTNGSYYQFADETCTLTPPSITAADITATHGESFAASDLFAATDSDGDVLEYQLVDATAGTGAHFLVNGAAQSPMQLIDLSAAQLALTTFQSGSGTDQLFVRASNGIDWSAWASFNVIAPVDNPPTVTVSNVTAGHGQSFAAASLFNVTDADGDAMTKYAFWDTGAGSGHFVLNGVAQGTNQEIDVPAVQLAQLTYQSGSGADTLWVRANDGYQWSAWSNSFTVTAPIDNPPVVTVANVTAAHGQSFAAASLFNVTDADGDAMNVYAFWNSGTGGGHFLLNGTAQSVNQEIDVTAAQLSQLSFQSGSGTDTLWVRANDGTDWSAWSQSFTVTAPIDTGPVVNSVSNIQTTAGQTFAVSNLFTAGDPFDDPIEQYDFWDTGAGGGHFLLGNQPLGANEDDYVLASQLAQTSYVAGPGMDTLWVRVNEGGQWSPWSPSFTVSDPTTIGAGETLELPSAYPGQLSFAADTGTLKLDNSASFAGTVAGMSGQDTIDFADIDPAKVHAPSYSGNAAGGTLTVSDGAHSASIALLGNYMASVFVASSDGHGGTSVTDPQAVSGVQPLITPPHS